MKQFILTLLIIACALSITHAQTPPCKPKTKENKSKILVFETLYQKHIFWNENGVEINVYADSAVIKKDDVRINGFQIKSYHITDPSVKEYYPDGKIKSYDSLGSPFIWKSTQYYGGYTGWVVYSRQYYPSGIPERITYYKKFGNDSLKKNWYPNGVLQKTIFSNRSGEDSAIYTWSPEGILRNIKTPLAEYEYYPHGLLKRSVNDTIMYKHDIKCTREYYPKGTLRSVEYHYEGYPCHDWLYYTEQGTLAKTLKKAPISQLPIVGKVSMVERAEEVLFTYVEQMAEFPGGQYYLAKYLNEKLQMVACESVLPLEGTYYVLFVVGRDGSSTFKGLRGEGSIAIDAGIKPIINYMPKWNPGKKNGKNISTTFELQLKLKKI